MPTAVRAETVLKWRCSLCRANIEAQAFAVLPLGHGLCFHHVRSACLVVLKGRREAYFLALKERNVYVYTVQNSSRDFSIRPTVIPARVNRPS